MLSGALRLFVGAFSVRPGHNQTLAGQKLANVRTKLND